MSVVAVIPARGGSRSLPGKNLRPLAGRPLVAWSIAAARESRLVERILVSTDSPELRAAALFWGAEAPFLRPAALARDETPDLPVFQHVAEWLEREEGYRPDLFVQLRPTSPLRPPGLVDAGIRLLWEDLAADSVRSVTAPAQNPYKMWRQDGAYLSPLLNDAGAEAYNRPRQSLPATLWQTGHLDVIRRRTLEAGSLTGASIRPLLVGPEYAVDIDTELQLRMAELVLAQVRGIELLRPEASVCDDTVTAV